MTRRLFTFLIAAGGVLAGQPERAEAQVALDVHLFWHSGERGDWRPDRYARQGGHYVVPLPVRAGRARALRIPPGHLPPPGACRLWFPGRPPGHQPPPTSCARLFRSGGHPGAIIIGSPGYRGPRGYGAPSYQRGPRDGTVYMERGYRAPGRYGPEYDRDRRRGRDEGWERGRQDREEGWERGRRPGRGGPPAGPRGRGEERGRGGG